MTNYTDNDIIFKLGQYRLFDEFVSSFNISQENPIIILNTLKHVLRKKLTKKKKINKETEDYIMNFIRSDLVNEINEETNDIEINSLIKNNIDIGEAILLSYTKFDDSFLFHTGDKRFIKQLYKSKNYDKIIKSIYNRMNNKVICLEQIFLKLLKDYDYQNIRNKIISSEQLDKSIKNVFNQNDKNNTIEGLKSYLNDIKKNSGHIIYQF